jgi:hypothetical protein
MAVMAREALAEMNGSFHELWAETWPIPVAALTMAVVVLLVRHFALPAGAEPAWIGLILLSATGAITYGAVLLAIGRPLISEGAEVAGWVLRGRSANV